MKPSPKNDYDFRMFRPLRPFFETIYYGDMLMPAVEREQIAFDNKLKEIKKYRPRADENINNKASTLKNANLYNGREMIIDTFKNKLFPLASGNCYEEFKEESSESEGENEEPEDKMLDNNTSEQITMLDNFMVLI